MTPSSIASVASHLPLLSAARAGVEVDLNPTLVLVQLVVVTGLMLVLKPVLFDPMLKLFEEREKRVEGARAEARKMDDQAADILRSYTHEIEKVTKIASEERDRVRAEAQRLEAKEMAEARQEIATVLETGRKRIAEEAKALEVTLAESQGALSKDIAARVLGREVS
jgi:F-type H+-transporting ATPase subunit b